jgi:hypothetical protein
MSTRLQASSYWFIEIINKTGACFGAWGEKCLQALPQIREMRVPSLALPSLPTIGFSTRAPTQLPACAAPSRGLGQPAPWRGTGQRGRGMGPGQAAPRQGWGRGRGRLGPGQAAQWLGLRLGHRGRVTVARRHTPSES